MYPPILPLYDDATKVGLGFRAHPRPAPLVETLVLAAGLAVGLLLRPDRTAIWVLGGVIAICHVAVYAIPDRMFVAPIQTLVLGLAIWLGLPAAAGWHAHGRRAATAAKPG